jgi:sialic acid synthase SpsE
MVMKKTFIIAEAGVNHNGDINLAYKLIDAAKEAGADAVKFQTFKSEKVISKKAEMAEYQKKNTGKEESQIEMIKRLELTYNDFSDLKKYCD